MPYGYRAALALTSLMVLCLPAHASDKRVAPRLRVRPATYSIDTLYSKRALRRARIILELKLLDLRKARLERVRKAIERNVPIDQLLRTNGNVLAMPETLVQQAK